MNFSPTPVSFKANTRVLSLTSKLKDGHGVNLEIKSKAPKTYNLKCFSDLENNKKSGYGQIVYNTENFEKNSAMFIDKIEKLVDDNKFLTEIKNFFANISK